MAQKIFFTGFKGGCGVSTCCAGVALALAISGERALVIDGDYRCGSGMITGGINSAPVYTLADYGRGACRAKQTITPHPKCTNLCYCSSEGLTDLSYAEKAVADLDGLFDYILLDNIAFKSCDRAVIVTEPYTPSIKCADKCRSYLADNGANSIELIVNKLNAGQILSGETMTAREIAAVLHLPLVAVIPEDLNLASGGIKKNTAAAFRYAAAVISGAKARKYDFFSGYSGVSGFLKRKMRAKI